MPGCRIEFDQFQTALRPDGGGGEIGERTFQVALCLLWISGAFRRDSQQCLNPPKIGLQLQGGAHVGERLGILALKVQQYAEISLGIEVLRIERDDFAQQRNGELWVLLLKVALYLLFERFDFLLNILSCLRR